MNIFLPSCTTPSRTPLSCFVIMKLNDRAQPLLKVKGIEYAKSTLAFSNYKDANLFIATFVPVLSHNVKVVQVSNLPQPPEVVQLFSWKEAYALRCQDCACLAQDSRGSIVCDEAGQNISAVICCPEGLSLELTYGVEMTF